MRIGLSLLGLVAVSFGSYLLIQHINGLGLCLLAWSALCMGIWQAQRLQIKAGDQAQAKPKVAAWRFWGVRLSALLISLIIGVGAYSQYLARTYQLQSEYHWLAVAWVLGINRPYPELVEIPAGRFEMGSSKGNDDEKPIHTVIIPKKFFMGKHEVSFTQYDYYLWQKRQQADKKVNENIEDPLVENLGGRLRHPAINVNWEEAQDYVAWLSQHNEKVKQCRLPSEAEWEYAARAGSKTKYYWGEEPNRDYANYDGIEGIDIWGLKTAPVGSFKPNAWGLYDMSGNVFEWTQDRYHDNYQNAPEDGSAWESGDRTHVFRGGSWSASSSSMRSAFRINGNDLSVTFIGFRVICSPVNL
ncbi:formylglycine-generating enzyme family protein [Leucothrix sargassi]|nr:formylglycine-generating enzyme family protein [Leucothrix sargassi]